jgi:hypothetical protein
VQLLSEKKMTLMEGPLSRCLRVVAELAGAAKTEEARTARESRMDCLAIVIVLGMGSLRLTGTRCCLLIDSFWIDVSISTEKQSLLIRSQ